VTTLRIITQPYPNATQRVELDGTVYSLRVLWSQRGECWHLDLGDGEGDAIVSGLRLVTGFPLLYRFRYLAVPPGELWFFDSRGQGAQPTLEDMGDRFRLYYESVA
jgi:hypothetical protein